MRKILKEQKRFKIGACFGVFICILLICVTIYFTPNFVANNLSTDGILEQTTIFEINFLRLLSTIGSLIIALYIIKPNIFIKFYSNMIQNRKQQLKLMLSLFPIVFVICTVLVKSNYPDLYIALMARENSLIEWLTFICYFIAFIVSFSISITYYRRNSALFFFMYMLLSMGLFFIAMEEISWGQKIFNVSISEFFIKYNYQKEMNLHNIKEFPLHALFIIVGLYGAFSRFIIPKKLKIKYSSTVNLFVPDYHLFFYFFVAGIWYLYYDQLSPIAVTLFGDWVGFDHGHFMWGDDQEPVEFLLSCGFLLFVTINKYRQVSNKNFGSVVTKMKH